MATFWGPLKGSGSESGRGILGDPKEPHPGRPRADMSGKRDPHAVTRKSPGDAHDLEDKRKSVYAIVQYLLMLY